MHPDPKDLIVEEHREIGSTQERMRERIRAGENVHGHVVRADRQYAGVGTRGRAWSSERGGSYQTVAVRLDGPQHVAGRAPRWPSPGISVAIGIGLASTLTKNGARVMVKWPNDLYYHDKKLGGILCEFLRGYLMIGVGINVGNEPLRGSAALRGRDLAQVNGFALAGTAVGLDLWASARPLNELFSSFDWLAGRHVEVRTGGRTLSGVARGVAQDGALLVGEFAIRSGTVSAVGARER